MLPPFIIEQIRRREEKERQSYEQPRLELPMIPQSPARKEKEEAEEVERGVIVVELL